MLPSKNWEHIYSTSSHPKLSTENFERFVDDSHARFNNREQSLQVLDILNSQAASIQYTIEFENENKQLCLLDITITNTGNNSYDFKIFRKTNVHIKLNSNIAPHTTVGAFKGFVPQAYKICTEEYLQSEIDFFIDIFTENGHNRSTLTNIAIEYVRNINKPKGNIRTTPRTLKTS